MEQSDPASASDLAQESEVNSLPKGSSVVNKSNRSDTTMEENEVCAERGIDIKQESLEGDGIQHEKKKKCQQEGGEESVNVDISCDIGTASIEDARTLVDETTKPPLSVLESTNSVLEVTIESLSSTLGKAVESPPAILVGVGDCSTAIPNRYAESQPADVDVPLKCSLEPSPTKENVTNSPATPSTPSSAFADPGISSPRTMAPTNTNSLPSPYDTDCSRKLMTQIQRSVSQESLLDELEQELFSCQLPERGGGGRKGGPHVNGMQVDQDGSPMVFEKCIQYKYVQQEKAIKR